MRTDRWERADLVRRVRQAVRLAVEIVDDAPVGGADRQVERRSAALLPAAKAVDEAAMLAWAAAAVRDLDPDLDQAVAALTQVLRPHARSETVRAGLLLDPGRARDHAHVHILLSRLGHRDPEIDDLLRRSVADGASWRPERLPHRELEQLWLARLAPAGGGVHSDAGPLRRSSLGRPLDPLSATPLDAYAFTHAVLYASDFGARRFDLPREPLDISADAEATLAAALDLDDLDLAAELLWTWPMLGLDWPPGAAFAFSVLLSSTDPDGVLPGPDFDRAACRSMAADRATAYRQATCYHSTFVLGFLCAAALRVGGAPPAEPPGTPRRGPGPELVALVEQFIGGPRPRWLAGWSELSAGQQHALTDFATAAVLARARNRGDLELIRASLQIVSRYGALAAPTPRRALALLQRAASYGSRPEPSFSAVSTRG